MVPAEAVRDVEGIVDAVGTGEQRQCAIEVAQDPVLLKPADVADLPDGGLKEMGLLPQQLRIVDAVEKLQLELTRIDERSKQAVLVRSRDVHRIHRLASESRWALPATPASVNVHRKTEFSRPGSGRERLPCAVADCQA